jgi:MHS family proline/betaine transporter-like MFS transporter
MIDAISPDDRRVYRRRVIVAVSIGNALEWFDFIAYGFLAVTMAKLFFPTSDPFTSLLLTFATFGIPFLARPLGAVVIGAYADRRGRKAALVLTVTLMMIGALTMAVTPTDAAAALSAILADPHNAGNPADTYIDLDHASHAVTLVGINPGLLQQRDFLVA